MVDAYHLEILRGTDLMGRWYLADVEARREIAERFTLFLGDDEMEFLADDALVFAYEGVTRMQQGWANAKKRKRRHRRAAADAARRKDEAPSEPEPLLAHAEEPTRRQPEKPTKVPTSDLAKKLAAIASAEAAADGEGGKRRFTWAEAEALELAGTAQATEAPTKEDPPPVRKPRKPKPSPKPAAIEPLYTEPFSKQAPGADPPKTKKLTKSPSIDPEQPIVEAPAAKAPTAQAPTAQAAAFEFPVEVAPVPAAQPPPVTDPPQKRRRPSKEIEVLPVSDPPVSDLPVESPPFLEPEYPEPSWIAPPPARLVTVDLSVEEPVVIETPIKVEESGPVPAMVTEPDGQLEDPGDELTKRRQRRKSRPESSDETSDQEEKAASQVTNLEAARGKQKGSGHHPAETNVGLLAKLRRPPKTDQEHVHTYQESRSSGGLTRRVCLECSHVSITSDD